MSVCCLSPRISRRLSAIEKQSHHFLATLIIPCANESVDAMLLDLCGRKYEYGSLWWKTYDKVLQSYPSEIWPITCQTMEGHLLQSEVYVPGPEVAECIAIHSSVLEIIQLLAAIGNLDNMMFLHCLIHDRESDQSSCSK